MPAKRKIVRRKKKPTAPKNLNGKALLRQEWVIPEGLSPAEKAAALEAWAELQGIQPIQNLEELKGDFWPEDENVDEFLAARKRWQEVRRGPKE